MKHFTKTVTLVMAILLIASLAFGAALTADRLTNRRNADTVNVGVAIANKIYAGSMVAIDSTGYAVAASADNTLIVMGRAESQQDNSSGAAGALNIDIGTGVYGFANTGVIADTDIGKTVFVVDDQTVSLSSLNNTRPVAGKIYDYSTGVVWVDFSRSESGLSAVSQIIIANSSVQETDSDSKLTITHSGILATDKAWGIMNSSTTLVAITNVSTSANTVEFILNAPGGAGTTALYWITRDVQ